MNMKHEYREFLPSLVTLTCILTKLCSFLTTEFSVKNMIFYQTRLLLHINLIHFLSSNTSTSGLVPILETDLHFY